MCPKETIRHPDDSTHVMSVETVDAELLAVWSNQLLAHSNQTLRVLEVGKRTFPRVFYFPRSDVSARLARSSAQPTYCPIKGDPRYFDLLDAVGNRLIHRIAWFYEYTFGFTRALQDLIAFSPDLATVTEAPFPRHHVKEFPNAQKT